MGIAAKLAAVAAMVGATGIDASATDRFSGGSSDGYCQSETQWITQFTSGSRSKGGSFDGYCAVTVQGAMLVTKGTVIVIH